MLEHTCRPSLLSQCFVTEHIDTAVLLQGRGRVLLALPKQGRGWLKQVCADGSRSEPRQGLVEKLFPVSGAFMPSSPYTGGADCTSPAGVCLRWNAP